MEILIVVAFIIGYLLIALEHPIHIDKAASAVLTGVVCWTLLIFGFDAMPAMQNGAAGAEGHTAFIDHQLYEHLGDIASILFFLLGAMTIVELVDAHEGFKVITDRINTTNRVRLLWILSVVAFFLSAALDNMTTAIVMSALVRRLARDKSDLWLLGGFIIIAANAGGAWSPIGDVTTIMLWIGGQITAAAIIKSLFFPSLVSLLLPLLVGSVFLKGVIERPESTGEQRRSHTTPGQQRLVFALGVGALLFVPVFKNLTHLPPFMGIMLGLGVLWFVTEMMHKGAEPEARKELTVASVLRRIDTPSILFFLGILLAVAALQTSGHLGLLASGLDRIFSGNIYIIDVLIGLLSAVVDNVPLVAAAMGMYTLDTYPVDHAFWELLAFCAGTGGSILIIGSAAGVATMGVLKVDFLWYLRRVSLYALIGYFAGVGVYYLQSMM